MGAKHSFRFPNGGGCPFLYAFSAYSKRGFCPAFLILSGRQFSVYRGKFSDKQGKRGKNEFLFGGRWCFLGKIGDKKGRNLNIFLKSRKENRCGGGRLACLLACPLAQRWAGFRGFRTCRRLALILWSCVPSLLSAFLLCSRCVACKYGSISHFKGVFRGFPLLDVGLYCLRALRGLWGFCVREVFGGFMACGVFAFLLSFCLYPFAFRFISLLQLFVLHLVCFVLVVFCLSSCLVFPFLLCL